MGRRKSYAEKIRDHIKEVVQERRIEHTLHFTRLENVHGIFHHGLLSRSDQLELDYSVYYSDANRLDRNSDAISVSVSSFNHTMFAAKRERSGGAAWAIIAMHPALLWQLHCRFYEVGAPTTAAKHDTRKRIGGFALERLFSDPDSRAKYNLPASWPTHPDPEVQLFNPISNKYILGVWVENDSHGQYVQGVMNEFKRDECNIVIESQRAAILARPYSWGGIL